MARILIDMDGTIYNLYDEWYWLHNLEYSKHHELKIEDVNQWDVSQVCKDNNCPVDIFKYLLEDSVWTDGSAYKDSIDVTKRLAEKGYELAVATSVPYSLRSSTALKYQWLNDNFPHIPNIITVSTHTKHWLKADFMIDDGIHNLKGFEGIAILYDQPWNRDADMMLRARDWQQVDRIIQRGVILLEYYSTPKTQINIHKLVEERLKEEIKEGKL